MKKTEPATSFETDLDRAGPNDLVPWVCVQSRYLVYEQDIKEAVAAGVIGYRRVGSVRVVPKRLVPRLIARIEQS